MTEPLNGWYQNIDTSGGSQNNASAAGPTSVLANPGWQFYQLRGYVPVTNTSGAGYVTVGDVIIPSPYKNDDTRVNITGMTVVADADRPAYVYRTAVSSIRFATIDASSSDSIRVNLLGAVGDGWRVATTTLMNERVALGGSTAPRGSGNISMLMKLWEKRAPELDVTEQRVMSDRVMKLWIEAEVGRLTTIRGRSNSVMGNPGPEGSVGKLASAELNIRIWNCCMDLLGDEGMLHEPGYPMNRDSNRADWSYSKFFLRSQANTIEGGTSDIMRNILGERVLGLPGEPRVDKAIPWTDIPA